MSDLEADDLIRTCLHNQHSAPRQVTRLPLTLDMVRSQSLFVQPCRACWESLLNSSMFCDKRCK
jgi:hypothetical protein